MCSPCLVLGRKKFGKDVCYVTGGDCAKKDQWPAPPDTSGLTLRAADAFRLFNLCGTQWTVTMDGPFGLSYLACERVAQIHGIDFEWVFPLLQALERERLGYLHEKREAHLASLKKGK